MTETENNTRESELLLLTAEVVSSYLGKNTVAMNQIPDLIRMVHGSLSDVNPAPAGSAQNQRVEAQKPAVPIRRSITPDYIICLEDGKKLKMLKRHLRTVYGMTPEQYRAKWNLDASYPMVAPNYARQRSMFAKQIGLGKDATGRKPRSSRRASGNR